MALRKEQVLVVAVAAILALLAVLRGRSPDSTVGSAGRAQPLEGTAVGPSPLAGPAPFDAAKLRDTFSRPAETESLPPLDWPALELPPCPELAIVEPPVQPGPALAWWYLRRIQPEALAVRLAPAAEGEAQAPKTTSEPPAPDGRQGPAAQQPKEAVADDDTAYGQIYDFVVPVGGRGHWAQIVNPDKYSDGSLTSEPLVLVGPFQRPLIFNKMEPRKGTVSIPNFPLPPAQIERIRFADTIRNRIGMRRRRIAQGESGLKDRERFVHELLIREWQHPEARAEAELQAEEYIKSSPHEPGGYELKATVYVFTGEMEKELALYDELSQGPLKNQSFVARGRGALERRLGLFEDAERHLREAVDIDPVNPLNHLALSRLYLDQGRIAEAVVSALDARKHVGPTTSRDASFEVQANAVALLLAAGRTKEAAASLAELETLGIDPPRLALLRAGVLYAQDKHAEAKAAYSEAVTGLPDAVGPVIGAGLCSLRLKEFEPAWGLVQAAQQRDPVERHLALAAQAFVALLAGRVSDALGRLEEARRMAPLDPYVLYLSGRAMRVAGLYDEARAVLDQLLRDHHDCVEAMGELVLAQVSQARQSPERAAELLTSAQRFASRAVQVEAKRGKQPIYQDLLGIVRYHLNANEAARKAFQASVEWGGDQHPKLWLALISNRAGDTSAAISQLNDVWQVIRDPADPYKVWADTTRQRLAYHRGMRVLTDTFDRPHKRWVEHKPGHRKLSMKATDGQMRVSGVTSDEDPAYVRLELQPAKDLVEVGVDLTLGREFQAKTLELRISDETRAGPQAQDVKRNFEIRMGYERAGACIYFREGSAENQKNVLDLRFDNASIKLERGQTVRLGVRVERGLAGSAATATVVFTWDGKEIARKDTRGLLTMANKPLFIDFLVEGGAETKADGAFDDFRLVRLGEMR